MLEALETLGFDVEADEQALSVHIKGSAGTVPENTGEVFVHQAGTVMRFVTAAASLGEGPYRIDGDERMRQRPIGPLVAALRKLGADIRYVRNEGFPPLEVKGRTKPGKVSIDASVSSQFISGLLVQAAGQSEPTRISLEGQVASRPFIDITLKMLAQFGAKAGWVAENLLEARGPLKSPGKYAVEADATAASYFWAAAAITGGEIKVGNLSSNCVQGDLGFADVLAEMGCTTTKDETGIEVKGGPLKGGRFDLNAMPDVVQTLAVVALFADGKTRIENVANLRVKETDRLSALEAELGRLGAKVGTGEDWIEITPSPPYRAASLRTYDDHRMAMSLALAGLRIDGVEIEDPDCVSKTFPEYFHALQDTLGVGVEMIEDD
jgi:3-phosphoshikimate 1-carboxyvinyltransferase